MAASGDGAMQMLGNAALIDLVRYRDCWTNRQLVVLVLHNDDLNHVTGSSACSRATRSAEAVKGKLAEFTTR